MAFLKPLNPESLGAPRGYSNGMVARVDGRLLFVAGQIGWDRHQKLVSESFADQFHQSLANVLTVVRSAGGHPDHLAQLTIYVTDRQEYQAQTEQVGQRYRELMGRHYPAMALVEVSGLLEPGAKVEIQAMAVLPSSRGSMDVP